MGEYETLGEQVSSHKWETGCPLAVEEVSIVKNTTSDKIHVKARLRNVGGKAICAAVIKGTTQTDEGEEELSFNVALENACDPGKTFEVYSKAIDGNSPKRCTTAVASIAFTDQTAWSSSEEPQEMPPRQKLDLPEKAMAQRVKSLEKIYKRNSEKVEAAKYGKTVSDASWWSCSCGAANVNRDSCWNCSAGKEDLIAAQSEEQLCRLADEEAEAEAESARKAEERKAALAKNKPKIIGGGIAVVVVIILIVLAINVFMPLAHIGSGDSARASENWDTAIGEYTAANGFGESSYYVYYCKCMKAISEKSGYQAAFKELDSASLNQVAHVDDNIALGKAYLGIGDYEDAIKCYEIAGDYADSSSYIFEAYTTAADSLAAKGEYDSAVDLLETANNYGDAKDMIYKTACEGGAKSIEQGEASEALALYQTANKYGDASERVAYCETAQKLESAEANFQKGYLNAAQSAYSAIPADFTFNGINAGQRQDLMSSHQEFVDICGTFSGSNHMKVTQTHKRTGSWNSWDGDAPGQTGEVICKIKDNGTVDVSGKVSYYKYTSYSSISAGVRGTSVDKVFSFNTTSLGSENIGGDTTIDLSGGTLSFNYYVRNENESVSFDYTYEANGTYEKSKSH